MAPVAKGTAQAPSGDLKRLVGSARQAIGTDAMIISGRSQGRERFSVIAANGPQWGQAGQVHAALANVNSMLAGGEIVEIRDLAADPATSRRVDWSHHGFASLLSAPLELDGEVIGTMHALQRSRGDGKDDRRSLVEGLARHMALAVGHKLLRRRTARMAETLEAMSSLDRLVLSIRNFEEMDAALSARVAPLVGARTSGLMVWDERRGVLQMMPGSFDADDAATASCRLSTSDRRSNSARVFATGTPYMSNHASGDPAILQDYVDLFHVERLISLPLQMGGSPIGVLHLANKPSPFTAEDLDKAEALAGRVATAVELFRTVFELRRQQRLEGILSRVALGIVAGKSMSDLLPPEFEELGTAVEAKVVALTQPERRPILWQSGRRRRELERQLTDGAGAEASPRTELVEPRFAGDPGHAIVRIPVRLSGKRVAELCALRARGVPFASDEVDALSRLANLAALAWAAEKYQHQRAELARLRERQRIADDLHDHVAQILFAAQLNLDEVLERPGIDEAAGTTVARARGLLLRGDSAIREVIHELSRPHRADLAHRLALLVQNLEDEFEVGVHLDIPEGVATAAKTLRRAYADALVKVACESIVNAAKHAGPCKAVVQLRINRRGRLVLSVMDDGLGMSPSAEANGHGLKSLRRTLREHGGMLRVSSGRFGGTKVTASIPL
jgi:signal transduction histidine kinase